MTLVYTWVGCSLVLGGSDVEVSDVEVWEERTELVEGGAEVCGHRQR